MADDLNLSQQDVEDLRAIRAQMHIGDPRAEKIDGMLKAYSTQSVIPRPAPITTNEGLAGVARPNVPVNYVPGMPGNDGRSMPGSFEGHPENVGEYVPATVGRAAEGAVDMSRGNIAMGLHKEAQAVGNTLAPMAPVLAAGAPLATVKGIAGGYVGGKVLKGGASLLGASKDQQNVAEDVGNIAGGYLGTKTRIPLIEPKGPIARPDAIANLRRAINPIPNDAPGFLNELDSQLDTIANHAKATGQKPTDLDSLAKVTKSAADADPYRKTFVEPFKDEPVSTSGIRGYQGGTKDYNTATISQLDKRLTVINKTLNAKYMRGPAGSVQQVASVGADPAADLQTEAAGIRDTLARELSKRTGYSPEQIGNARKNYGQLNDLADTIRYYADEATHAANADKNGPVSLSPFQRKEFVVDKAINRMRGDVRGKLIKNVFENYNPAEQPVMRPDSGQSPELARYMGTRPKPPVNGNGKAPITIYPDPNAPAARTIPDVPPQVQKSMGDDVSRLLREFTMRNGNGNK